MNKQKDTDDIFHFDDLDVVSLLDFLIELVHEVEGSEEFVGKVLLFALQFDLLYVLLLGCFSHTIIIYD